jgi:aryl-alcohol dehydrogenase-like predicted oxidoreductase
MEQRRLGRLEHPSSVLIYGAAALADVGQDVADASIAAAIEAGINHFDVARSYGDAELRMGPWAGRLGPDAFLATKTGEREREAAWRSINESLERLQVDRVDLIQLHAVGDLADLDRATGTGGALEAAVRARDEGLVGAIGITGHGDQAPATHVEALRRFAFDTVLSPWNFVLAGDPAFRADFLALVEACGRDDVGLMTIKTVSRRNWPDGADQSYATWYEPWDDPEHIDACVAFVLREPGVTGIATAGDVTLLDRIVSAAARAADMSDEDIERVLGTAPDYSSPFLSMPW